MVTPMTVHGADISHHQDGNLDLVSAKAHGLLWLYHKATEGNAFRDSIYTMRRAQAKAAGLPFGGYHFARAAVGDAAAEAEFFLSVAQPDPADLRPALDLETTEGLTLSELRTWAKVFITAIEKAIGVKPLVYTPFDLGGADDGCIIWRPRYNDSNTPPVLPFDIWQFSNGVLGVPDSFPGIGHVDLNTMRDGLTLNDMLINQEDDVVSDAQMKELKDAIKAAGMITTTNTLAGISGAQIAFDADQPDGTKISVARQFQSIRETVKADLVIDQEALKKTAALSDQLAVELNISQEVVEAAIRKVLGGLDAAG